MGELEEAADSWVSRAEATETRLRWSRHLHAPNEYVVARGFEQEFTSKGRTYEQQRIGGCGKAEREAGELGVWYGIGV